MTKDEAITVLLSLKEYYNDKNEDSYVGFDDDDNEALDMAIKALEQQQWISVSERLPSKEERKEWIDKNLDGIGYLYPCLVTRYSSVNPDRTKNNPYVAKHYYDGEDFVNNGEEVCSEYVIAWMPLPEPYVPDICVWEMSESEEGE